jgi:hypothetical protein
MVETTPGVRSEMPPGVRSPQRRGNGLLDRAFGRTFREEGDHDGAEDLGCCARRLAARVSAAAAAAARTVAQ